MMIDKEILKAIADRLTFLHCHWLTGQPLPYAIALSHYASATPFAFAFAPPLLPRFRFS
jgi:hypothetical protein